MTANYFVCDYLKNQRAILNNYDIENQNIQREVKELKKINSSINELKNKQLLAENDDSLYIQERLNTNKLVNEFYEVSQGYAFSNSKIYIKELSKNEPKTSNPAQVATKKMDINKATISFTAEGSQDNVFAFIKNLPGLFKTKIIVKNVKTYPILISDNSWKENSEEKERIQNKEDVLAQHDTSARSTNYKIEIVFEIFYDN